MAFTQTPTGWFPDWSEDATNITVPIASLPGLTAATADGATGDIRKILYAIMETCWAKFEGLTPATRPTKLTIKKSSHNDEIAGTIEHQYLVTFITEDTGQTVADE